MDQYPKLESIGSIGSIILAILEVQVYIHCGIRRSKGPRRGKEPPGSKIPLA